MIRSAIISPDGLYRYELRRGWGDGPEVCWAMLNPSTADAENDDPTLRKVVMFSDSWGFGSLVVVNLFAARSSKPKYLQEVADPVGPENAQAVEDAICGSEIVVCAWGAGVDLPALRGRRGTDITAIAARLCVPTGCLGRTERGRPVHPLYISYDRPLVPYGPGRLEDLQLPKDCQQAD